MLGNSRPRNRYYAILVAIALILSVGGAIAFDAQEAHAVQNPRSQNIALVPDAQGHSDFGGVLPTSGFPGGYSPSFTDVSPEAIRDDAQDPLAAGFDTVVLNGICDIASFLGNAQFKSRVEGFARQGGKLIIWDSECSSTDYSNFALPFSTNNPGQAGATGTLTDIEENTLSSSDPSSPSYVDVDAVAFGTDAVGDANVFQTHDPGWFLDLQAQNVNGVDGAAQAYANLNRGLVIYSGLDKDDMSNANGFDPAPGDGPAHLNRIWMLQLLQPWDPDGLPHGTPIVGVAQRFFQFNMCGSEGSAKKKDMIEKCDLQNVAGAVAQSIRDFQPIIVTLNEACASQVAEIKNKIANPQTVDGHGPWPMEVEFDSTTTQSRCSEFQGSTVGPSSAEFGNAVLVSGPKVEDPKSPYALPDEPGKAEQRSMVCVFTSSEDIPIHACSAHLIDTGCGKKKDDKKACQKEKDRKRPFNRDQVFEVARLASSWASSGQAVVIGGDFNLIPEELGALTNDQNFAQEKRDTLISFLNQFSDVDDQARDTHDSGAKWDYIFLSHNHFRNISGFPTETKISDHKPLRGFATLFN